MDIELGAGGPADPARVFYRDQKTKPLIVFGTTENFAEGTQHPDRSAGRFFNGTEVQYRQNVVRARQHAVQAAVRAERHRPDRQDWSASAAERFEVVGVFDKRPAAGGFNLGQDDFVVIPYTAYQRIFGLRAGPHRRATRHDHCRFRSRCCRARASSQEDAMADVERVMRIRHGLQARRAERLRPRHAGRRS